MLGHFFIAPMLIPYSLFPYNLNLLSQPKDVVLYSAKIGHFSDNTTMISVVT